MLETGRLAGMNLVLIVADDLGYGDIGLFNNGLTRTPNIDDVAKRGLCLSQHYSASPVCAPSRAAILTGRYPQRTGCVETLEALGLDRMHSSEVTIADYFHEMGYATGLVGKWHNGALDTRYFPTNRGFDEFVGFCGGWQDYYDWYLVHGDGTSHGDGRYLTDVFADEAAQFIRRHAAEPFMLFVTFNAPHFPIEAPESDVLSVRERFSGSEAVATLYAMVERMDRGVGQIRETLGGLGLDERTLVMFTSDNGPQLDGEGAGSLMRFNCDLRGEKLLVFEGGIRLPMLMCLPGLVPEGACSERFVHTMDWLPTLTRAFGWEADWLKPLDGAAVPDLRNEGASDGTTRFWQWNAYAPRSRCNAAMRDGPWKLVYPVIDGALQRTPEDARVDRELKMGPPHLGKIGSYELPTLPDAPAPRPMLFNLEEDPEERHDRGSDHPDRTAQMSARLESWYEEMESARRTAQRETLSW